MNLIYENTFSATKVYPEENNTAVPILHNGRRYKLMGESLGQKLSHCEGFKHVMTIIGLVVAAIFTAGLVMAPLFVHNMFNGCIKELQEGAHINLHYVALFEQRQQGAKSGRLGTRLVLSPEQRHINQLKAIAQKPINSQGAKLVCFYKTGPTEFLGNFANCPKGIRIWGESFKPELCEKLLVQVILRI